MGFDLRRDDTICAIATPRGRGGVAIVRVSGPAAVAVRDRVFRRRRPGPDRPFVVVRGDVVDDAGQVLDDGLCTTFIGPRSLTGEDVVEIAIHGGSLVQELVVERLVQAGCRVAGPGEFSLRAVLSGRMDLAEAEAVAAVVAARTSAALVAAQKALRGGLRAALTPVRARLIDALAELEARLDFPDEPLGDADRAALVASLQQTAHDLAHLVAGARRGRRMQEGARVVLWGAPNAGKSTLLNALVGHERALVDHEPGTTRDVIEATIDVAGIPVVVVDVAGIRDGDDVQAVEARGIALARREVARADVVVVLHPADGDPPPPLPDDVSTAATVLVVRSRIDLAPASWTAHDDDVTIAAINGRGIDALLRRLAALLTVDDDDDAPLASTARQEQGLGDAGGAVTAAADAVATALPDELACSELRRAGKVLDGLLGTDVGEDVLDVIFSRFCIGK